MRRSGLHSEMKGIDGITLIWRVMFLPGSTLSFLIPAPCTLGYLCLGTCLCPLLVSELLDDREQAWLITSSLAHNRLRQHLFHRFPGVCPTNRHKTVGCEVAPVYFQQHDKRSSLTGGPAWVEPQCSPIALPAPAVCNPRKLACRVYHWIWV